MINALHKARQRRDEGFTLIELLIVIVVLGILATIVVFGVGTFRQDAQTAACKADVKTVSVAVDAYYAKSGTYVGVSDLVTLQYLKSAPPAASAVNVNTTTGAVTSSACP